MAQTSAFNRAKLIKSIGHIQNVENDPGELFSPTFAILCLNTMELYQARVKPFRKAIVTKSQMPYIDVVSNQQQGLFAKTL